MEKKNFKIWKEWVLAYAFTIIFVIQKLTNQVDWDWIWVFSPIWGLAACCVGIFLIVYIVFKLTGTYFGRIPPNRNPPEPPKRK